MNRKTFLKYLLAAPALAIPKIGKTATPLEVDEVPAWPFDEKLSPFQEEIWKDYHLYDKNLFLMPRRRGKTFMAEHLVAFAKKRNVEKDKHFRPYCAYIYSKGRKEIIFDDYLINSEIDTDYKEGCKMTIFVTPDGLKKRIIQDILDGKKGSEWNVKQYNNLDIIGSLKELDLWQKVEDNYRRQERLNKVLKIWESSYYS